MNKKLLFALLLVLTFLIGTIASIIGYSGIRKALREKEAYLKSRTMEQVQVIEEYFQEIENELSTLISEPETKGLIAQIEKSFKKGIYSTEYVAAASALKSHLRGHGKAHLFGPATLVSREGRIVYGEDAGRQIYKDSLKNEDLARSLLRAHLTQTLDMSQFIATKIQDELYLTLPLGIEKGVISFPVNLSPFQRRMIRSEDESAIFEIKDNEIVILTSSFFPIGGSPFTAASTGNDGSGITYIGKKKVLAAWHFIPKLNWGIVMKIDYESIAETSFSLKLVALLSFVLFLALLIIVERKKVRNWVLSSRFLFSFSIVLIFLLLGSIGYLLLNYKTYKTQSIIAEQIEIRRELKVFLTNTSKELDKISKVTEWMGKDLEARRLKFDDLQVRLNRDFNETPSLERLIIIWNDTTYVAAREEGGSVLNKSSDGIYLDLLKNRVNNEWFSFHDEKEDKDVGAYVYPLDENQGIIALYDIEGLKMRLDALPLGASGKAYLFLKDEQLPGSEIHSLSVKEDTFATFSDLRTKDTIRYIVETIPHSSWKIAVLFKESHVEVDPLKIHHMIFLSVTAVFLVSIIVLALLCPFNALFSVIYSILVFAAILALWITEHSMGATTQVNGLIIHDRVELDNFMMHVVKQSHEKNFPKPLFLPTGIWIQSLELQPKDYVSFSGLVWQKYPGKDQVSHMGIHFSQASPISLVEVPPDGGIVKTWRVRATIPRSRDIGAFPFDNYLIKIQLEPASEDPATFLVPDISSYAHYAPENKPGINPLLTVASFQLKQSFFSIEKEEAESYSIAGLGTEKRANYILYYNIYLVRNFLTPFIPFFIPLVVILIGLYMVFLIAKKKNTSFMLMTTSAYGSGFFATALLQMNLRNHYAADNILYAETFFFVTFCMVSLLYIHTIIAKSLPATHRFQKLKPIFNLLYWPILLTTWYIIAFFYFYEAP